MTAAYDCQECQRLRERLSEANAKINRLHYALTQCEAARAKQEARSITYRLSEAWRTLWGK